MVIYKDRRDAGMQLADFINNKDCSYDLILALPRGGVPVAYEIAKKLNLPLDVFIVRKLGVPGHEEVAMGAIATGGVFILNEDLIAKLNINQTQIENIRNKELNELNRREALYRHNKPLPSFENKNIILVDDGVATGSSMKAAILALKSHHPASITIAIPVAERSSLKELSQLVDDTVCLLVPELFYGVGQWYEDFPQLTDQEVCNLLMSTNQS
jgi:predicted phosphoribosyltransferase